MSLRCHNRVSSNGDDNVNDLAVHNKITVDVNAGKIFKFTVLLQFLIGKCLPVCYCRISPNWG